MDLQKLLDSMTLEEKLGQLLQVHTTWFVDTDAALTGPAVHLGLTESELYSVGSLLNFNSADEMLSAQKTFLSKNKKQIPMLFMDNVVHGHCTNYPIPLAMGGSFNPELLEECCDMAAREAAASGVHVTFAPMLDLVRDARWGRVMESTGEDPYLNCVMARSFVRGFQGNFKKKHNIAVCVKHFAAYGAPEAGRDYNTVDMSERNLREYYLPAYKAAIDEGAEMVMTSFNTLNGVPATGNPYLMNDILRDEWGFDKILITDYNAIKEMIAHGYCADDKEAAWRGIQCNVDIEMMSSTYMKNAEALLDEGKITMDQIDAMVMRVLKLKKKLGLFARPYSYADPELEKKLFCCKKHRDIARRAAEESIVLLENDGVLPLKREEKIALIGPFANEGTIYGNWDCIARPEDTTTVLLGMQKAAPKRNIRYAMGCGYKTEETDQSGFREAMQKIRYADKVVLCLGEYCYFSGEGRSRAKINVPEIQLELLRKAKAMGKPIVSVVFAGRPLEIEEVKNLSNAVIYAWQPGTEGGSALANILYGKVNPSGKLAMCLPYSVGQLPIYYNHFNTGRPKYRDVLPKNQATMVCESMYADVLNAPLYPFGYGKSYTAFEYSNLMLDKTTISENESIKVTVDVKNTGECFGREVVQLYLTDLFASVVRPVKELKGFKKISLEPGETKTVEFTVDFDALKFYNQKMEFVAEPGEFKVAVGTDCNADLTAKFTLE